MKAIDVYREALSRGLTGKEAAYEYGIKYHTLMMAGYRHKLPALVSLTNKHRKNMYRNMTIGELDAVYASLQKEIQVILSVKSEKQGFTHVSR